MRDQAMRKLLTTVVSLSTLFGVQRDANAGDLALARPHITSATAINIHDTIDVAVAGDEVIVDDGLAGRIGGSELPSDSDGLLQDNSCGDEMQLAAPLPSGTEPVQSDISALATPPMVTAFRHVSGNDVLTWTSVAGGVYQLEFTTSLTASDWKPVGSPVCATGNNRSATNAVGTLSTRFYRIVLLPAPCSPCLESLNALGIQWTWGPQSPGVTTPVTVALPLDGMPFRFFAGNLRNTWFMDCELAVALHRMVQVLKARGVVEVVDIGIYNYRCIGEGTPPDCPQGLSMHARALAVDIAALVTPEFGRLSIEDDWVIDPTGATCAARQREPRDAFLHSVLCEIYNAGIFTIHLSPNYNAAHRNHWHLDLTPDSGRFIR